MLTLKGAPDWAMRTLPKRREGQEALTLILINMPADECWVVASLQECNAIADPNSFTGRLLAQHTALLSLPYLSWN